MEDKKTNTSSIIFSDSDTDMLFCHQERLDQNSPELWPEQIPGVTEFTPSTLFSTPARPVLEQTSDVLKDPQELTNDDIDMLQELGSLTIVQIIEKFQELKNQAYQLGLEESKEMTRGRYLNVLGRGRNSRGKKKK